MCFRAGAGCQHRLQCAAQVGRWVAFGDEMTGHGFRAMARTLPAERLDVDEAVIEAPGSWGWPTTIDREVAMTDWRGVKLRFWLEAD